MNEAALWASACGANATRVLYRASGGLVEHGSHRQQLVWEDTMTNCGQWRTQVPARGAARLLCVGGVLVRAFARARVREMFVCGRAQS